MLICCKFTKEKDIIYLSHIDMLRQINRAFRRSDFDIDFSQGFNPHILLNLSPPVALGIKSTAEYFTLRLKSLEENFIERFNEHSIEGLKVINAFYTDNNPNYAAKIIASEYVIDCNNCEKLDNEFKEINKSDFIIDYTVKGKKESKEVKDMIFSCSAENDKIKAVLATGNKNLRADRFINTLNQRYNLNISFKDVVKTRQFAEQDGKLVDIDEVIKC